MHDARAALARVAADVRAGQTHTIAQHFGQQLVRSDFERHGLAIQLELDLHVVSPKSDYASKRERSALQVANTTSPTSKASSKNCRSGTYTMNSCSPTVS